MLESHLELRVPRYVLSTITCIPRPPLAITGAEAGEIAQGRSKETERPHGSNSATQQSLNVTMHATNAGTSAIDALEHKLGGRASILILSSLLKTTRAGLGSIP